MFSTIHEITWWRFHSKLPTNWSLQSACLCDWLYLHIISIKDTLAMILVYEFSTVIFNSCSNKIDIWHLSNFQWSKRVTYFILLIHDLVCLVLYACLMTIFCCSECEGIAKQQYFFLYFIFDFWNIQWLCFTSRYQWLCFATLM